METRRTSLGDAKGGCGHAAGKAFFLSLSLHRSTRRPSTPTDARTSHEYRAPLPASRPAAPRSTGETPRVAASAPGPLATRRVAVSARLAVDVSGGPAAARAHPPPPLPPGPAWDS